MLIILGLACGVIWSLCERVIELHTNVNAIIATEMSGLIFNKQIKDELNEMTLQIQALNGQVAGLQQEVEKLEKDD